VSIASTHEYIKGSPFQGTGAKLVSFDKDAFVSMGLEQGHNAPVSEEAQRKYTSAINALLEWDTARKRRKSAIALDESVVIFWTKDRSDATAYVLDVLNPLPESGDAVAAGVGVWKGMQFKTFSPTPFYACTLAANAGRVVVRDWFERMAGEAAARSAPPRRVARPVAHPSAAAAPLGAAPPVWELAQPSCGAWP